MDDTADQATVGMAGISIFVLLYGGKAGYSLTALIYLSYMKMAASSTYITPSKLPPTERTAHFHSLRVYIQVVSLFIHKQNYRKIF